MPQPSQTILLPSVKTVKYNDVFVSENALTTFSRFSVGRTTKRFFLLYIARTGFSTPAANKNRPRLLHPVRAPRCRQ